MATRANRLPPIRAPSPTSCAARPRLDSVSLSTLRCMFCLFPSLRRKNPFQTDQPPDSHDQASTPLEGPDGEGLRGRVRDGEGLEPSAGDALDRADETTPLSPAPLGRARPQDEPGSPTSSDRGTDAATSAVSARVWGSEEG